MSDPISAAPAVATPTTPGPTPVRDAVTAFQATVSKAQADVATGLQTVQATLANYSADLQLAAPTTASGLAATAARVEGDVAGVLKTAASDIAGAGGVVGASFTTLDATVSKVSAKEWVCIAGLILTGIGGYAELVHLLH